MKHTQKKLTLATSLLLASTLMTACGEHHDHPKAVDMLEEAEQLAKEKAPKAEIKEEAPKPTTQAETAEAPKTADAPKVEEQPKTENTPKTDEQPAEAPKAEDAPKTDEAPKADEAPKTEETK